VPNNGEKCDDGQYCSVNDTCQGGACIAGPARDCTAFSDRCNLGACDEAGDTCYGNPGPKNGLSCNDGDVCTTGDRCVDGSCEGTGGLSCEDGNSCTRDLCDRFTGCFYEAVADGEECGRSCDDNLDWLQYYCRAGECTDSELIESCVNDDICTDDACDDASGCSHPFNDAPCDDGEYCSVGDRCDQGECAPGPDRTCKDEAGECWQGRCREEFNWCELGEPEPAGEPCDDGDPCTDSGSCNGNGACRIEGFCDKKLPNCDAPGALYVPGDPEALDCRLGENKVGLAVEVEPTPGGAGTFVPVRVLLSNTTEGGWSKPLSELRVLLTLNPEDIGGGGGRLAYVMDSALLQGGELHVDDDATVGQNRAFFRLFRHDAGEDLQMMPAPGEGLWVVDFVLMRGEEREGVFGLDVWAPCECLDPEIGCHYGYDPEDDLAVTESIGQAYLQRVSGSKYVSTSGKVIDDPENAGNIGKLLQSPVLGCQCGVGERGGSAWLLLLGLLWAVRRQTAA
jgi:MYXO-CTERM domain-containing protein